MSKSISVCIPTYRRPDLLRHAVGSCLKQTMLPAEILIGDDSPDDETRLVVEELATCSTVPLRYFHNKPGYGQARNVDRLIHEASGELISVLHDDDEFEPTAFRLLAAPFDDPEVVASYGKQFLMSEDGVRDIAGSEELNRVYSRTDPYAGAQRDTMEAAIVQQFPNDCYLVSSHAAKHVGYARAGELGGDACDYMFGLLLAQSVRGKKFYFVNRYTSAYRTTFRSVTNRGTLSDMSYYSFKRTIELEDSVLAIASVVDHLSKKSSGAISQALNLGHRGEAVRWFFSKWHRRRIATISGLKLVAKFVIVVMLPDRRAGRAG
ncbi:glycosyltransferase family 2 protein [Cupriavidus sp. 30B13]|uniref:glycosyltransferase family 2 protein n=1 Tax=Cupriavidus sp. 30B13 TaxID=3384241 RepID=UPI003B8F5465